MNKENIESRLNRLEWYNRLYLLLVVGLLGLLILGSGTQDDSPPEILRARRFDLIGPDGGVAASLVYKDGGPGLYLMDPQGRDRVATVYSADQGGFFVLDSAGHIRVGSALFGHGGAGVALHSPDMKGSAVLYYKQKGTLTFYGPEGKVIQRLPAE